MRLFFIARDGGLVASLRSGVEGRTMMVDVPFLPNTEIQAYYTRKQDSWRHSQTSGELPAACDHIESWGGRKCADYCEVAHLCPGSPHYEGVKNASIDCGIEVPPEEQ
jgi:hypothetical protein